MTISKKDFIARADAICARYITQEQPLRDQLPRDDSPEAYRQVADLLPKLGESLRRQVTELRALEAPDDVRGRWKATLDLLDKSADKMDEGAAAAGRFDRPAFVRTATEALAIERRTGAFADEYGFTICGSAASRANTVGD